MGPVLGSGDWQLPMSLLIMDRFNSCVIVNPSRYTPEHPLYKYRVSGLEDRFEHQTAWERYFISRATEDWPMGCVICWLACESEEYPRSDGLPYAVDTRGEIGELRGRMMYQPGLRVAMGAEVGFPGLRTIERNFEGARGSRLLIHRTMEDVVEEAARQYQYHHPLGSVSSR